MAHGRVDGPFVCNDISKHGGQARGINGCAPDLAPPVDVPLLICFANATLKARSKGTVGGWMVSAVAAGPLSSQRCLLAGHPRNPRRSATAARASTLVWWLVGLVPWNFFQHRPDGDAIAVVQRWFAEKVYLPSYIPIISMAIAVGVQSLIELGSSRDPVVLRIGRLVVAAVPVWPVIFVLFTVSVSYVRGGERPHPRRGSDPRRVIMQLVFFMTPIIFLITMIPVDPHGIPARAIVAANPLALSLIDLRSVGLRIAGTGCHRVGPSAAVDRRCACGGQRGSIASGVRGHPGVGR